MNKSCTVHTEPQGATCPFCRDDAVRLANTLLMEAYSTLANARIALVDAGLGLQAREAFLIKLEADKLRDEILREFPIPGKDYFRCPECLQIKPLEDGSLTNAGGGAARRVCAACLPNL